MKVFIILCVLILRFMTHSAHAQTQLPSVDGNTVIDQCHLPGTSQFQSCTVGKIATYIGNLFTCGINVGCMDVGGMNATAGALQNLATKTIGTNVAFGTPTSVWVNTYFANDNLLDVATFVSPNGLSGTLSAARSSDNTGGPSSYVIPLKCLVVNDTTASGGNTTECAYFEGDLTASSVATEHFNEESTIYSLWANSADADPYHMDFGGKNTNLRLDTGKGGVGNKSTNPIDIFTTGAVYREGIIFGDGSLDTSSGRIAPAILFPQKYSIDWYSATGNAAWRLYSTATSGNNTIILGNGTMTTTGVLSSTNTTASTSANSGAIIATGSIGATIPGTTAGNGFTAQANNGNALYAGANSGSGYGLFLAAPQNYLSGNLTVAGLPASAGAGGLNVCSDTAGVFYRKATCP